MLGDGFMSFCQKLLLPVAAAFALLSCAGPSHGVAQTRIDDFKSRFSPKKSVALTNSVYLSAWTMAELSNGDLLLGSGETGKGVLAWIDARYARDVTVTVGEEKGGKVINMEDLHTGILASRASVSVPVKNNGLITVRLEDAVVCQTGDKRPVIVLTIHERLFHDELTSP
jgi:hypothetical protein